MEAEEANLLEQARDNPDELRSQQLVIRFLTGQGKPVPPDIEERSLRLGLREEPENEALTYSLVSLLLRTGRAPMPEAPQPPLAERELSAEEAALERQLLAWATRAASAGDDIEVYTAIWQLVVRVPGSALSWCEYARNFAERGAFENARTAVDNARAMAPLQESSRRRLMKALKLQDEAYLLEQARDNPDELRAQQLVIGFLTGQGKPVPPDIEERSLRLGLREKPEDEAVAYSLVSLLLRTGRAPMPEALQPTVAERVLSAEEAALERELLGRVAWAASAGDDIAVYTAIWQLVVRVPVSALGWCEYARNFAERGAFENARTAVDRAQAMAPLLESSRRRLMEALEVMKEKSDAQTVSQTPPVDFNAAVERVAADHLSVFWGDRLLTLDKSAGFLDDPAFRAAFESVRGAHQYDQYGGSRTIAWRLHTLCWAAKNARAIEGDFVECGVFKGDMAWVVLQVVGVESTRRFYLYDSFQGFSPKWSSSDDFPESPGFIDFANQFYREEGMYERVVARFARFPQVRVVKGFVPESFSIACPERVAFLHIDLNSPAAEVAALEILWDRVPVGGIIVFDDYGWKLFHKQKEAEDEFMKARGHSILELPTGQGLVVKH